MDEPRAFGHVPAAADGPAAIRGDSHAPFPPNGERDDAGPRRLTLPLAAFYAACAATGLFAALIVGMSFRETLREPIGLLLAVAAAVWAATSISLYRLGHRRACDRAIVMGGGFASAVMCSMMFFD